MKADIYKLTGKKGTKKVELNDDVFGVDVKPSAISQYVYSYLSNQRQATAHTKDRSEVRGGGKKPWRQKGTGRARTGSLRNPIFTGGGITFGPRNNRNWKKNMNLKFKRSVLRQALSNANKEDRLRIVEEINIDEKKPLTKQVEEINKAFDAKKVTVITTEYNKTVQNAFTNLDTTRLVNINELNAYDVIYGGKVLLEEGALKILEDRLSKNNK